MKQNLCELCWNPAKLYCESDRANLCWDCDLKVHGVNFLVTRHRRTLLCHACQNPTPWRASGSKLTPSVSVCGDCAEGTRPAESTGEFDGVSATGAIALTFLQPELTQFPPLEPLHTTH
ncbi:hypothetical protein SAY87_031283 [Trapa incisa]|uniref:B box-type domain-containing protein n=1 Tax=Trapa incisa TaxID=236973 RepID=A0AAN7KWS7_9MYRT|nr:hypothetical protein SAY87_031283 [Trapa incisa]